MGNIIDYARTETRDFGELPFREADALVLAQLSYDDVPECVPRLDDIESRYGTLHDRVKQFDPRHPIRSVRMLRKPPFDGVTIARADDELHHGSAVPDHNVENVGLVDPQVTHDFYHAIAANPRFSGIEMGAFLEQFDGDEQTQFAAATYRLPSGMLVVAFRGTDDSLVGWKEDFNMAFQYPVPAQVTAADYLARVAELWKDVPIVLTGHSKGGNLAVYAAIKGGKHIQNRLRAVYNFDGPGFNEDMVKQEEYQNILPKLHTLIPQSSVIGMLLEHEEDYTVVESTEKGLLQHRALSWKVMGSHFVYSKGLSQSSIFWNETLKQWIAGMEKQEKKEFVDALFEVIETAGIKDTDQLYKLTPMRLMGLMKAIDELPEKKRETLSETIRKLADEVGKTKKNGRNKT